jgi:hypothetical protein
VKRFFKLIGYGVLAFFGLLLVLSFFRRDAERKQMTEMEALAHHDLAIERDCRQQVHLSPECRAALDRLDFMRTMKSGK